MKSQRALVEVGRQVLVLKKHSDRRAGKGLFEEAFAENVAVDGVDALFIIREKGGGKLL
jgi:hypothetical protein